MLRGGPNSSFDGSCSSRWTLCLAITQALTRKPAGSFVGGSSSRVAASPGSTGGRKTLRWVRKGTLLLLVCVLLSCSQRLKSVELRHVRAQENQRSRPPDIAPCLRSPYRAPPRQERPHMIVAANPTGREFRAPLYSDLSLSRHSIAAALVSVEFA